jgi:hypothetical protein
LNYVFEESSFHPFFFFFPLFHLVLCNYVLDRIVGGFNCLLSFPWLNFCVVIDFIVSQVNVVFLSLA